MEVPPSLREPPTQADVTSARRRRTRWVGPGIVVLVVATIVAVVIGRSYSPVAPAAPTSYTIFGDAVPTNASASDDKSVELGVRITTASPGWITAIRYYRGPQNTGEHKGTLWGSEGEQLAQTTFRDTTAPGWQEARLSTPVPVQGGSTYTASYSASNGHYSADPGSLSPSKPVTTRDLTAVQGVFTYDGGVPESSSRDMNYYVDVEFTSAAPAASSTGSTVMPAPSSPIASDAPSRATRPGSSSTGVPAGTTLTAYTGPLTITTAGTVIDAKDITGALVIRAKGVTIRNSKIHDDPRAVAGVYVEDSGSATITDSEIYNFQVGITYSNWTAVRVDLHDLSFDGVKIGSNVRLQDSWVHSPKPSADAHWDGGQVQAGVTDTVIQGNYIDVGAGDANSALFLTPDLGPSTAGPLTVKDNWLDGGNFTLAVLDGDGGKYYISAITVTGNRIGRGGRYGPANVKVPVTWSGNVWDDTGTTINR